MWVRVKLLEALGYRVHLADRVCCGRPMVSSGMLDRAIENAKTNVAALIPHVEAGAKIVGCESSCILTLKDEYPDSARFGSRGAGYRGCFGDARRGFG